MHACDPLRVVCLSPFEHHRDCVILLTERVCRWKTFWIPSGDTCQKAYLEELEHENDEHSHVSGEDKPHPIARTQNRQSYRRPGETRATPRVSSLVTPPLYRSLRGKQLENQTHRHGHTRYLRKALYFGEPLGAPLLDKKRVCNFIHPKQVGPFPKRLILPYLDEEILSSYEEDVSSKRDGFSAWVKTDFVNTLGRHTVDVKGVNAAFRDAPARKHSASGQEYHFNNDMPNRLTEQKRLSVYNWNPGPQRGKEGAIEKHIAVKWHIITLQEAIEYLDQEFLTNRFHVTQYGGCAILLNKDTFFPDIKVTSLYLHDLRYSQQDKVKEGGNWLGVASCHIKGIFSPAATWRQIVLHCDVVAHQQQLCQEARHW